MIEYSCVIVLYCICNYGRGLFKLGIVGFIVLGLEVKFEDLIFGLLLFVNLLGEICVRGEFIMKGNNFISLWDFLVFLVIFC